MIENGLTPVMALRACLYPCHKSCFYRHLHNILDKVCDMRVNKIVDEYKRDVEVIEENEKVAENNNLSTRRQLFLTSRLDGVVLVYKHKECISCATCRHTL